MKIFYRFAQYVSWFYFKAFHRLEVHGIKNVPQSGSFILASNHSSYFDPPALGCRLPRNLHYFARDSLFFWPLGLLIRNLNSIPVNRSQLDIATLKRVLKVLKGGDPLLLFPEGTRSADGNLGEGKKGIGLLLAKSQVDVLPARVTGGNKVLGKGMLFPRIGRKLVVEYGTLLKIDTLDPGKSDTNRYEIIANKVLAEINRI
ncbi:lysophospholipid acyltransferase family protein [Candidatus Chordibacter forsetii]|uniref:lysophospholipid acyltransferase family protein n=1 Tax=Candidatus Chordibacter forsetii TaxID=3381758 RepID=UPI00230B670A|nr:1-acyl-sn-glycerol-3-phosphate acyltransferase [Opitutales bacterium]